MRAESPRSSSAYFNNSSPERVSVTVRLSLSNNLTPKSLSSEAIREEMAVCVVCNFSDAALKLRSLATHTNASIKRRFIGWSIRSHHTRPYEFTARLGVVGMGEVYPPLTPT